MTFQYIQYFENCLLLPLELIIFFTILFIMGFIQCLCYIRKNKVEMHRLLAFVIPMVFACIAIVLSVGKLVNGGIFLIKENEQDSVQVSGVIESIDALHEYEFPRIDPEDGYYNGVLFTVDGIEYKGICKGDLKVGDMVTITYLPKSGYILTINSSKT